MFRGGSIQIARVFGIRIGVDASWFLVLFIFIYMLSGSFKDVLDGSDTQAYFTAVASALLFFCSLILHELGHALVAKRLGIGISGIDLWFFGGVAKMTRDSSSPRDEFLIAAAGPAVTVLVVAICTGLGIAVSGTEGFWDAAVLSGSANLAPAELLLSWLATINAVLFIFNLIPAFPLDGGRIVRAAAWKITGSRTKATRFSGQLGRAFAYVLIGLGAYQLIQFGGLSGIWLIGLGLFLSQAARGAVAQTDFSEQISAVRIADVMDSEPVVVPAQLQATRAFEEFFLRYGWERFPVVDDYGRPVGVLTRTGAEEFQNDPQTTAGEIADRLAPEEWEIRSDEPLETLLSTAAFKTVGIVAVVDSDGRLCGVVTVQDLRRALRDIAGTPEN